MLPTSDIPIGRRRSSMFLQSIHITHRVKEIDILRGTVTSDQRQGVMLLVRPPLPNTSRG